MFGSLLVGLLIVAMLYLMVRPVHTARWEMLTWLGTLLGWQAASFFRSGR